MSPTRFTPNRPVTVLPGNDNVVNWKDLNPRLGASYDLPGMGKTALKFSATRGVAQDGAQTATSLAPANFIATSITLTVTGATIDTRTPNCDLMNPVANGQSALPAAAPSSAISSRRIPRAIRER